MGGGIVLSFSFGCWFGGCVGWLNQRVVERCTPAWLPAALNVVRCECPVGVIYWGVYCGVAGTGCLVEPWAAW